MKTIRFICTLMVVALFASCSADSDILNEIDQTKPSISEEFMTLSLNLSAENITTRGASSLVPALDNEKAINNYDIWVFGNEGVLLKQFSVSSVSGNEIKTAEFTVKKQNLNVYAVANMGVLFNSLTTEEAVKSKLAELPGMLSSKYAPTYLPKTGSTTYQSGNYTGSLATINVVMSQLAARIDFPQVIVENSGVTFSVTKATLKNVNGYEDEQVMTSASNHIYVYPSKNTQMVIEGTFTVEGDDRYKDKSYTFPAIGVATEGTVSTGNLSDGILANHIYRLTVSTSLPELGGSAALWIDWYVADMITKDIHATVGGGNN